jgi:hypothetical protein
MYTKSKPSCVWYEDMLVSEKLALANVVGIQENAQT